MVEKERRYDINHFKWQHSREGLIHMTYRFVNSPDAMKQALSIPVDIEGFDIQSDDGLEAARRYSEGAINTMAVYVHEILTQGGMVSSTGRLYASRLDQVVMDEELREKVTENSIVFGNPTKLRMRDIADKSIKKVFLYDVNLFTQLIMNSGLIGGPIILHTNIKLQKELDNMLDGIVRHLTTKLETEKSQYGDPEKTDFRLLFHEHNAFFGILLYEYLKLKGELPKVQV
jgi:hypothetical protein